MFISKDFTFEAGHRLPKHKSKCRNFHGHSYQLRVLISGKVKDENSGSDSGMVIDFSDVADIIKKFVDNILDHTYIGHEELDRDMIALCQKEGSKYLSTNESPTAENISKFIFAELYFRFKKSFGPDIFIEKVILWETKSSFVECGFHDLPERVQQILMDDTYQILETK